jgi:hypothetical protein
MTEGTLQWKHEDEEGGIPMGPVYINGEPKEWLYKPQAIELAKKLNLKFEEA